ncbi:collagen alpha-1(XV) chain-like [Schistocerca nitens]|uniref:collagen alpha-1(XV) chain-like n=1 Tax=Schistocerca nitens TaxID=7011 RepID=UPI00211928C9|nr:collagen alpha-1(XV) chain-like [Schistocerca nitens]
MGQKGEPGEPGAPSFRFLQYDDPNAGRTGPAAQEYNGSGHTHRRAFEERFRSENAGYEEEEDRNVKIVPGAVTFDTTDAMTRMTAASPVGTLAYVMDEQALLVRVAAGWQYVALGSLMAVSTQPPPTTTTTERPSTRTLPIEAFNVVNEPSLRLAALNEPLSGDMHGIRGADNACYRQARRAGFRGTFRALLASRVQNADSIVRPADRSLPVVNTKGEILFTSWRDMFNGDEAPFPRAARIFSFNGKNIMTDYGWSKKLVWHGSTPEGERKMDAYCDAWQSTSGEGLASPLASGRLLAQERFACGARLAVLCIEASSQLPARRRRRGAGGGGGGGGDEDEDDGDSPGGYGPLDDEHQ